MGQCRQYLNKESLNKSRSKFFFKKIISVGSCQLSHSDFSKENILPALITIHVCMFKYTYLLVGKFGNPL